MAIPELAKFRAKYPQYGDIDDVALAGKLASKYPQYADLAEKVKVEEPVSDRGFVERMTTPMIPREVSAMGRGIESALPQVLKPVGKIAAETIKSTAIPSVMGYGSKMALEKPGLTSLAASGVLAPAGTVGGVIGGELLRSAVPPKYKDIAEIGGGILGGGLAEAGAMGLRKLATPISGRIINSMIGPSKVAFKYGKNPGKTAARLVRPANSLEQYGKNIDDAIMAKTDELAAIMSSPKNAVKRIDYSEAFNLLDDEIAKLSKAPQTNAAKIEKVKALRDDLFGMAQGQNKSLSPEQALDIKRTTGDVAKWTGGDTPPEFEGLVHRIYHKMRTAIESSIKETKGINEDIAGLIGASKAMPGAIARSQRGMLPFMARTAFSGAVPAMAGGGVPGALLGMGANAALSAPITGTRIARGLARFGSGRGRLLPAMMGGR